jgi:phage-related protein (TIGR01555 family)
MSDDNNGEDDIEPKPNWIAFLTRNIIERAKYFRRRHNATIDNVVPILPSPFMLNNAIHGPNPIDAKNGARSLALDQAIQETCAWAGEAFVSMNNFLQSAFQEGITWLGYPYLSTLAQRPEYEQIADTYAGEMTRKWIKISAQSDHEDKTPKIKEIERAFTDLKVREVIRQAIKHDMFFGRGHIYVELQYGKKPVSDDRQELITDVGDGTTELTRAKIPVGSIKYFRNVEPIWTYPTTYDSIDPLKADWYHPTQWLVMGKQIHRSRIPAIIGEPVPDLLKPLYQFGGIAKIQMMKPYVDNWLRARQSVSDLISSFTTWKLKTNLSQSVQLGGEELFKRLELFNDLKDNQGLMALDLDTENLENVSVPLGSLDELQAQSQEHMASIAQVPAMVLFGISPHGMNASGEGELRVFTDHINALQEKMIRPVLDVIFRFVQLHLWGEIDTNLVLQLHSIILSRRKAESRAGSPTGGHR